jgi:hypothetical protein
LADRRTSSRCRSCRCGAPARAPEYGNHRVVIRVVYSAMSSSFYRSTGIREERPVSADPSSN